jgi:hypothetical protein
MDELNSKVGATDYWTAATSEYGVGKLTATAPVHLTESAPTTIDDTGVQTWLSDHLTGKADGGAPFPAPTSDSLYVIYYPVSTTVTLQGSQSCTAFGGYHSSAKVNGKDIVYAVVPQCDWKDPAGSPTDPGYIQTITTATSHELIEAVTDPYPVTGPRTYTGLVEPDYTYWEIGFFGYEVGDMCSWMSTSDFEPAGLGYTVQRTWSNKAAAAGHDPCQPALPNEPAYYAGVPVMSDSVTIKDQGQSYPTTGIKIPVGKSKTIEVDLFSDVPTGDWTVQAIDYSDANLVNHKPNLTFTWDKPTASGAPGPTGNNGDKLHLTITVVASDPKYSGNAFVIKSTNGTTKTYWPGYVGN